MRRAWVLVLIFSLVLGINAIGSAQDKNGRPWDGAGRRNIKECLEVGVLPNLKKLSAEGALVAIDALRTTDTKAGWAQIFTGYEPEITGVFSNELAGPIPKGYSIFERLKEFFGKDNFVTVAVISKKKNFETEPPRHEPGEDNPIPAGPYYYTQQGTDVFITGVGEPKKVVSKTLELLERYQDKPFFFFVHFRQIDVNGHMFGENSKEYTKALISADYWTGVIIDKLKELDLYEVTLIYVTSDHGFDAGSQTHKDAPYIFLATNDSQVMRRGERKDIAPTILKRFGLDLAKIQPPFEGRPLTEPYEEPKW